MSLNAEIAQRLDEIAQMMQLTGENPFKISAHERAARALRDLATDARELADDPDALKAIEGVGEKIAAKIIEFIKTGDIAEHRQLREKIPAGLLDVLSVPGLGPKTVKLLWEKKGVESVADLKRALEDDSLADLPRMGKKTIEKIRASLAFAESAGRRAPLGVALPLAERVVERLATVKGVNAALYAGSLRRGRDTIGDIDILAAADAPGPVSEAFRTMPEVEQVLGAGEKKSSVRARFETPAGAPLAMQVDLRVVEPARFGAALLYFTGAKDHNVHLRELALERGYSLNEYGLFRLKKGAKSRQGERALEDKPAAARTEADIYQALGLRWIPPELREDLGELDRARTGDFNLLELADINAELHAHTTASDGALSIVELAKAAKARGFHTIAVTDHSKSQVVANGLSIERLREHVESIRQARSKVKGIQILAGSEVDILADGSLDYDDQTLALLDIVVASPHSGLGQEASHATKRLLKAAGHPRVDILGHPTGRLIGRRAGLSPDIGKIAAKAAENSVALEVNAHWLRLDLRDAHVRAALGAGACIAINCDVHGAGDFDNLRFGVLTARRGGLEATRCVNAWSAARIRDWLARKPAPAAVRRR